VLASQEEPKVDQAQQVDLMLMRLIDAYRFTFSIFSFK
jgi:hypothetical protein